MDRNCVYSAWRTSSLLHGENASLNFYWVPAKLTEFDWSKTDYTHTPAISHEDLTALRQLPKAQVEATLQIEKDGSWAVRVRNSSNAIAFQLAVSALGADGMDISPMPWSDNYLELLPGEVRTITAKPPSPENAGARVVVSGWNISSTTLAAATEIAVTRQALVKK